MELQEVREQLQAIADRCETKADVEREMALLSADDKAKIIYETATDDHFEAIKQWSLWLIDFVDEHHLINDYKRGTFMREAGLGMLRALVELWLQSSETQGRLELQAMTEASQFGVELSDYGNDLAREMKRLVDQISSVELAYKAVLVGRQNDIHFLNGQADHVPYSEEEKQAELEQEAQQFDRWQTELRRQRAELEAAYWGEVSPPELTEEEGEAAQLVLPLWAAGYAAI